MTDDVIAVSLEQDQALARRALHILGTVTHEVTTVGGAAFDFAFAGHAETLFGPAVGL